MVSKAICCGVDSFDIVKADLAVSTEGQKLRGGKQVPYFSPVHMGLGEELQVLLEPAANVCPALLVAVLISELGLEGVPYPRRLALV
jgi:hypothetical protein